MRDQPTRSSVLFAMCCAAALAPSTAAGWGKRGHEIAATAAEARLGQTAQEMIREIVGVTPLADIATWADAQRDRETQAWHYVNVNGSRYDARRDCGDGECVVARIEWAAAELVRAEDPAARLRALRWIVHLVADVHQPLHASPFRDRGGNDVSVRIGAQRQPKTLHRVWDVDVVDALARGRGVVEAARMLARGTKDTDARAWAAELAPAAWADESIAAARAIYADLERAPEQNGIRKLARGYPSAHRHVAERRLAQAAVRLAALLDRIAAERAAARPGR